MISRLEQQLKDLYELNVDTLTTAARRKLGIDDGSWVEVLGTEGVDDRVKSLVGRLLGGKTVRFAGNRLLEVKKEVESHGGVFGRGVGEGMEEGNTEEDFGRAEKKSKTSDPRFAMDGLAFKGYGEIEKEIADDSSDDGDEKESSASSEESEDCDNEDEGKTVTNRLKATGKPVGDHTKNRESGRKRAAELHIAQSKAQESFKRQKQQKIGPKSQTKVSTIQKPVTKKSELDRDPDLHPSWKAKRDQTTTVAFQGTRTEFNSDSD